MISEKNILNNRTDTKRIFYFDYLRVMACINVIFIHTSADVSAGGGYWYYALTSWAFMSVPLFFMMSGYLLLSSDTTIDISLLIKKKIPHLLIPFVSWTIITIVWLTYNESGLSISIFLQKLISALKEPALNHFWFMYTIIAIYVISPVLYGGIKMLDKKGKDYIIILILFVEVMAILKIILPEGAKALADMDLITKLLFFDGHLCTFILGKFLGDYKKDISNKLLVGAALILWIVVSVGTYWLSVEKGALVQSFQDQSRGFEVFLAAVIFLLFKKNFNKTTGELNTVMISLTSLSLPIYLMHNILRNIFRAYGIYAYDLQTTIGITFVNFVICFIVVKTLASIKPTCFLFTGIRYEKACNTCNWNYTLGWFKRFLKK